MKSNFLFLSLLALPLSVTAQQAASDDDKSEGFQFQTVKEVKITPVKDQNRSSTCWSFSSVGFFEAELLRAGKGEFNLSEMFIVHHTMEDRAENYVRLHGSSSFSPGGSFYDAIYCWKTYGIVPQEAMNGICYGDTLPVHGELDAVAGAYVNAIAKGDWKKLTPVWKKGLSAIYDTYLGECPEEFTYNGKKYTPRSFADKLGLDMDDYVSITSYSHHPLYSEFPLEIEDNWRLEKSYNVTMDEMMAIIDNALENDYTIAWGADVSEDGFTRDGIGVVVDPASSSELGGSDMARWLKMSKADRGKELTSKPFPEMAITPEMRQEAFDNWQTTDDHGMLIFGKAVDQTGNTFYMVKNSWGTKSQYNGIWYISKAFVQYKTMNFVVNKNALPKDIKKRLQIK